MKIQIKNMRKGLVAGNPTTFDAFRVSTDPERRYAVAEILPNELFVAVKVTGYDEEQIVGEYVDFYSYDDSVPMLLKFTVRWETIRYGFCKLSLWAPELVNENGGTFDKTVKRFYF